MTATTQHVYPLPPLVKESRIKPTREVSSHVKDVVSQMKAYVWKYEDPEWDEKKQEWKWGKPPLSPKTEPPRRFKWGKENWEKNFHLLGTFKEAIETFEHNDDWLQGVGFIIEPYHTIRIDGKE